MAAVRADIQEINDDIERESEQSDNEEVEQPEELDHGEPGYDVVSIKNKLLKLWQKSWK